MKTKMKTMTPEEAYNKAISQGYPCDETRTSACGNARCAHNYAKYIDKCPREDTRAAACGNADYAYYYAKYIDLEPRGDTRTASCKEAYYAYQYALHVDYAACDETRTGACGAADSAHLYAKYIDKCPREDTRTGACGSAHYAYTYAKDIDKCPHDDTRKAAYGEEPYSRLYAANIDFEPDLDTKGQEGACKPNKTLTKKEKLVLLKKWEDELKELRSVEEQLRKLVNWGVESPHADAITAIVLSYTELVSRAVDDNVEWLCWYAYECDFGAKPKEVTFKNGDVQIVGCVEGLLEVIETMSFTNENENYDTRRSL